MKYEESTTEARLRKLEHELNNLKMMVEYIQLEVEALSKITSKENKDE